MILKKIEKCNLENAKNPLMLSGNRKGVKLTLQRITYLWILHY